MELNVVDKGWLQILPPFMKQTIWTLRTSCSCNIPMVSVGFSLFPSCLRKAGNAPFCASEISSRSYITCLPQLRHRASQTDPTICSHLLLLGFFASFLSSGSVKAFPVVQQSVLNSGGFISANSVVSTIGSRYCWWQRLGAVLSA